MSQSAPERHLSGQMQTDVVFPLGDSPVLGLCMHRYNAVFNMLCPVSKLLSSEAAPWAFVISSNLNAETEKSCLSTPAGRHV